jgi:hypothetical protein
MQQLLTHCGIVHQFSLVASECQALNGLCSNDLERGIKAFEFMGYIHTYSGLLNEVGQRHGLQITTLISYFYKKYLLKTNICILL